MSELENNMSELENNMSELKNNLNEQKPNILKEKWYLRLHQKVSHLPSLAFLLLMWVTAVIVTCLFQPLFFLMHNSSDALASKESLLSVIIGAVLIAPVTETLLFQFIPIEILFMHRKRKGKNKPSFVSIGIFSAALFAIPHFLAYVDTLGVGFAVVKALDAFVIGLILSYTYLVFKIQSGPPLIATTLLHSMINSGFMAFALILAM